jgi:uncharacterized protein (UPF0332 family)
VDYKREKARDALDDAKLLYENKRLFAAVNRIYYSLFYEVSALLLKDGLSSARHSGIMSLFQRNYIKTKTISVELGKFYSRMFEFRHKGDYGDFVSFEDDKVKEWLEKAETYIRELETYFD